VCSIQPLFNVFFQNYLGATAGQLVLLVTVIQLAGVFQILGIFLYGWIGRKKPIFIIGHVIHRSLSVVIAFVAFYVARGGSNERGIVIIIVSMGVSWIAANSSSACWWGWIADIFPDPDPQHCLVFHREHSSRYLPEKFHARSFWRDHVGRCPRRHSRYRKPDRDA